MRLEVEAPPEAVELAKTKLAPPLVEKASAGREAKRAKKIIAAGFTHPINARH